MIGVAAALVALLAAPAAAGGGFVRAKALEPSASYVARKPVRVMCATSNAAWHAYLAQFPGAPADGNGATVPGSSTIRLSAVACLADADAIGRTFQPNATLAPSIEVLTHESIHARGEVDEGVADCDAVHEMAGVAVRFFHVKAGKQLRALMAAAWSWRNQAAAGSPYRSVC